MFSALMGCGAVGLTIFYNLLDFEDWKSHYDSNGYLSITDDGNSNTTITHKWDEWGGCRHNNGCFKISFFVQAVFCVGATFMSHRILQDQVDEDHLPTADAQPLLPQSSKTPRGPEEEA